MVSSIYSAWLKLGVITVIRGQVRRPSIPVSSGAVCSAHGQPCSGTGRADRSAREAWSAASLHGPAGTQARLASVDRRSPSPGLSWVSGHDRSDRTVESTFLLIMALSNRFVMRVPVFLVGLPSREERRASGPRPHVIPGPLPCPAEPGRCRAPLEERTNLGDFAARRQVAVGKREAGDAVLRIFVDRGFKTLERGSRGLCATVPTHATRLV